MLRRFHGLAFVLSILAGGVVACDQTNFVVAIDPGHSRTHPGALSARGIPEVQFNEALARRLVDELQGAGFSQTFLTDRDQAPAALADRARQANQRGAHLFVSIHHDSVQPRYLATWSYQGKARRYSDEFKGYSLFVSGLNGDAAGSLRLARLVGSRLRRACLAPTFHHAEKIPGEGREIVDHYLGIYRFDDLVVLKATRMPAVLLEAGVIVNRDEEALLTNPAHQRTIAEAVTRAVIDFCQGRPPPAEDNAGCP